MEQMDAKRSAEDEASRPLWKANDLGGSLTGEILSTSPFIIQANFPSARFPLGGASVAGPILRTRRACFLVLLYWTIEPPFMFNQVTTIAAAYLRDHPDHQLIFLCNTLREAEMLCEKGFTALKLNHNCLLNDLSFTPKPEIEPTYDAVYNAGLTEYKRHDLAAEIERLALIYYKNDSSTLDFHAEIARLRALMPKAWFVNELTADGCRWISKMEVRDVLAQSRVGLCLSEREGAMCASAEYLFAGLSVVSTPSLGGRDTYFDDEFCIITEPDPRRIREAVEALIARNVPRDYVRARTLVRIEADRRRYIALVQDLIDRAGGTTNFEDRFWECTRGATVMHHRPAQEFSDTVTRITDGLNTSHDVN
jgi:hypothetical protein